MRHSVLVAAAMLAACTGAGNELAAETNGVLGTSNETIEMEEAIDNATDNSTAAAPGETVDPATTDAWVGKWIGVEGLVLEIAKDPAKGPGTYQLTMQYGLDETDKGTFAGTATSEGIAFTRPDGAQVLRKTDGAATGLKYLDGKKDCLTVKEGEGYCRD